MERVIIAKCTNCGEKKDVRSNEVQEGEVPMCDKCFSPMVAERAEFREDFI